MKPAHLILIPFVFLCKTTISQTPLLSSNASAPATILLDFDGHIVNATSWNYNGPINCMPASLTNEQIIEVFNRVAEDFRPFNINVTTDSTKYSLAPITKRTRVIITTTSEWYGMAGGVAFVNSFSWGDDTPCFVFSQLLGNNTKNIAEATSHEAGHTLGLYHQSKYDVNCAKVSDYNSGTGSGEIGWAPIMGVGYSKNFTVWHNGPNSYGCTNYQNDLAIIAASIGPDAVRTDDHANTFSGATQIGFTNNQFLTLGTIENNTDTDVLKFNIPPGFRFTLNASPFSSGINNSGANLDIEVSLYNSAYELLQTYNPSALLNSIIDTILSPGNYYLKITGTGNANTSNYGSLGQYVLQSSVSIITLPLHKLTLYGKKNNNGWHELSWEIIADENVSRQELIISTINGNDSENLAISSDIRTINWRPHSQTKYFYILKVIFDNGRTYYSNITSIDNSNTEIIWPQLYKNVINSELLISSKGSFYYNIYNISGQQITAGKIISGNNSIQAAALRPGLYIISFTKENQSFSKKFIVE